MILPKISVKFDKFYFFVAGQTPPAILLSTRTDIHKIDLLTSSQSRLVSGRPNVIALDYFYNHTSSNGDKSLVFWTDIVDDKIYKATLYANGKT